MLKMKSLHNQFFMRSEHFALHRVGIAYHVNENCRSPHSIGNQDVLRDDDDDNTEEKIKDNNFPMAYDIALSILMNI